MREELLAEYRNGNKRAGEEFYLANQKLINYTLIKLPYIDIDEDEKRALVNVAFTKAMNKFDTSKKAEFSTFFIMIAKWEIERYRRDNHHLIKPRRKDYLNRSYNITVTSLDKTIYNNGSDDLITLADKLGKEEDFSAIEFEIGLDFLTEEEKKILKCYWQYGYKQTEISKMLGISQPYISRTLNKIKNQLKERIA